MIDLDFCIQSLLQQKVVEYRNVQGGYTRAKRKIATLESGERVFVKAATSPETALWLREEYNVYQNLSADFMAKFIGFFDDAENPVLLLEDLSDAIWPKKWDDKEISLTVQLLDRLKNLSLPESLKLPKLELKRGEFASWQFVAANPDLFLKLNLCSKSWLDKALPFLIEIDQSAPLAGNSILHFDIRSDNLCFLEERVILVDWNWACIGNSRFDLIAWLPSLSNEGGPGFDELIPNPTKEDFDLALLLAGFWAYRAGMPEPYPDSMLRDLQLKQLKVILPWAIRGL